VAHAVVAYFCTPVVGLLVADAGDALAMPGTAALAAALDAARGWGEGEGGAAAQAIVHVTVDDSADEGLGHVFALHVLPDARVQLYQAFIRRYTLDEHLRRSPPMDGPALARFLANLAAIEGPGGGDDGDGKRPWTQDMDDSYFANFAVHLRQAVGGKSEAGRITVRHTVACVLPPHNGTAADLADEAWPQQEEELLPTWLRLASRRAKAERAEPCFEEERRARRRGAPAREGLAEDGARDTDRGGGGGVEEVEADGGGGGGGAGRAAAANRY